jgi:hypothetical protein
MSGLDSLLMSDFEVWITLAALGGALMVFVPVLGTPAWVRPRTAPKLAIAALLVTAAVGGLAWYGVPDFPSAVSVMAAAVDHG